MIYQLFDVINENIIFFYEESRYFFEFEVVVFFRYYINISI